jgi:small subunit ribosomal protein S3
MGQKVHPVGLRLGINRTWDSRWYAGKDYAKMLHQDVEMRAHLMKKLKAASISRIIIERAAKKMIITVYAARPGVIIGKKGTEIEQLRKELAGKTGADVSLNLVEVRKPELDAKLVAESITSQLERRVSFRRAMKRAVQTTLRLGGLGIRINCAGRLAGADIARTEWYREGRVPLHTLRANVDYALSEAMTTYGIIGVKVWIYKGDILTHDPMAVDKLANEAQGSSHNNNSRAA